MSRALAVLLAACVTAPSSAAAALARVPAPSIGLVPASVSAFAASAFTISPSALLSPAIPTAPAPLALVAIPSPPVAVPAPTTILAADPRLAQERFSPGESRGASDAEFSRAIELFDGGRAKPPVAADGLAAPAAIGSGLASAHDHDDPWLRSVVETLARSKTGRRVLGEIDHLAAQRGRTVVVLVDKIQNNGEFRYDSDLLVMDWGHLKQSPEQTAPIFAHELQHVLQRAMDLPCDALELELESYAVENRVWSELGIEPRPNSFAAKVRRRLREDPRGFVEWLGREYRGNRLLSGTRMESFVEWMKIRQETAQRRLARIELNLAAAQKVVERMRREGFPEKAIAAHVQDAVEPAQKRKRSVEQDLNWIRRDLALLSTEEGQKNFRAYSQGVMRRVRELSKFLRRFFTE